MTDEERNSLRNKPNKNETTPSQNTSDDGNIQSGTAVVDENQIAGEQNTGTENVSETADIGTGQRTIKIKTTDSGNEYTVNFDNGKLDVKDKNGKEPSAPTRRKIEEKYAEQFDFTQGDIAPETTESVNPSKYIADTSNNPLR